MPRFSRRKFLTYSSAAASSSLLLKACAPDLNQIDNALGNSADTAPEQDRSKNLADEATPVSDRSEIIVGLLHSLSGALAVTESALIDAERLAIEEINAKGGLLGKPLVPVVEDGASDWPTFAEKTEKLISQHGANIIFGGFTTASRKAILPVVTAKNKLLWYPGAYEGQECSKHIFYAGPTPNQQVKPAVNWMLGNRGKSFFLLSSDGRTIHSIVKEVLQEKGGKVAGEAFVPWTQGTISDMQLVIDDIKQALPDGGIIFNSLLGNHNQAFFQAVKRAGLSANRYLIMSVRVSEEEIARIGKHFFHNHYATWRYFQTLETPKNEAWVATFKSRFGPDRVVSDPIESAYAMVHLWAQAVERAGTTDTMQVREATYGQTLQAPSGTIKVQSNHHLSKPAHVGKIHDNGQFEILWTSPEPIVATPWSQELDSDQGYLCDWQNGKGERYKVDTTDA
ncbi:MAG: urea ABC transporter substrate-binding protein [Cyanobacteria bacterium J06632_3]